MVKILSYDIESTTGSQSDGSVCTFGYCLSDEKFNILKQEDIVINPHTKSFSKHIKLHYSKEQIRSSPTFPNHYEKIKELFQSADIVIGFSVGNDVKYLNNMCSIYNLERITYNFLDVQLLHKFLNKKAMPTSLENAMSEIGEEYLPHRSDEDARATLLVFKYLVESSGLSLKEFLHKQYISEGVNTDSDIVPCTDGSLTKKQKSTLILHFRDEVCGKIRRRKGVFSGKAFSFSEEIMYNDIDHFRKIMYTIYKKGGKVVHIMVSNVFVIKNEIKEREKKVINMRNEGEERTSIMAYDDLIGIILPLEEYDFSSDREILFQLKKDTKKCKKQTNKKHKK